MAYARQLFGGQGVSKKQIALNSGYSSAVSRSVKSHIEDKEGFNNAMSKLALDSNNIAISIMHEFKARGFKDFSNKDLTGALNAIGNAWSKFNAPLAEKKDDTSGGNKLKSIILQQIENQTFIQGDANKKEVKEKIKVREAEVEDPGF